MEREGQTSQYVYLVLKGQVHLMKRPENLYDKKTGKQIKAFNQLQCVADPHGCGMEQHGVVIGSVRGETFLCEDAALFGLPLSYTAVSAGALVYRLSTAEALEIWPTEC